MTMFEFFLILNKYHLITFAIVVFVVGCFVSAVEKKWGNRNAIQILEGSYIWESIRKVYYQKYIVWWKSIINLMDIMLFMRSRERRVKLNILEHYIVEIISVEPYNADWTKEFGKEFVQIKVITDCYGNIKESETVESKENWEKIREQGYFMW